MKQYYIYLTTNKINNMKYIGKHYGELQDSYLGSGIILKKAIEKYGKENFEKQILCITNSEEENCLKEKEYISLYDATNNPMFYNIHEGGSGGNTTAGYTKEQKENLKRKLSIANKGEKNGMYGKNHTEETKHFLSYWAEFIRDNSVYQTEEFRNKMSKLTSGEKNGMYGKKHSEESKKRMSESHKGLAVGENNGMYGKHHTEESKKKMSEAKKGTKMGSENGNSKKVILFEDAEKTKIYKIFDCMKDALIFFNISTNNYSGVNRSIAKNTPYKGYYWQKV